MANIVEKTSNITQTTPDIYDHGQRNYSHGYDSKLKAVGSLFEGVGNVALGAVKVADNEIQERIKNDLTAEYDVANRQIGVDAASLLAGNSNATPTGLQQAFEHLEKNHEAYQQGHLSQRAYDAHMHSAVRQLRARYPGYRDQIDTIAEKVMGSPTANALRRSLINEYDKQADAKSQSDKDFDQWVMQHGKYIGSDPDMISKARAAWGTPQFDIFRQAVVTGKATEHQLELDGKKIGNRQGLNSLDKNKQEFADQEIERGWRNVAQTQMSSIITQATAGKTKVALTSWIKNEALADNEISDDERKTIISSIAQIKLQMAETLSRISRAKLGDSDQTYFTYLGEKKVQDTIDYFGKEFDSLTDAIGAKDWRTVKAFAIQYDANLEKDKAEAYGSNDMVRNLAILNSVAPQAAALWMGQNENKVAEGVESLGMHTMADIVRGRSTMTKLGERYQADVAKGRLTPRGAAQALINPVYHLLREKNMGDEQRDQVFINVFKDFDTSIFGAAENREKIFEKFSDQRLVKDMIANGLSQEALDTYTDWVGKEFASLYINDASNLNQALTGDNPYMKVEFSEKDGKFAIDRKGMTDKSLKGIQSRTIGDEQQTQIERMNQKLHILKQIYEATPGRGAKFLDHVRKLLFDMGVKNFESLEERQERVKQEKGGGVVTPSSGE